MTNHITIPDTTPRTSYTATSSQTVFPVPWAFFDAADVAVEINGSPATGGYSVSGTAVDGGYSSGAVTFITGRTLGDIITIYRSISLSRVTDFPYPSRSLQIEQLNTELDRFMAISQDLRRTQLQTVRAPAGEAALSALPSAASRANQMLVFNASGNPAVAAIPGAGTSLTGNASLATVTATGATTAITLAEEFSRHVSVRHFGAVGNCTGTGLGTDDTAAFLAAIAYAKPLGRTVYVPAGSYRVAGYLDFDYSADTSIYTPRTQLIGEGGRQSFLYFDNGAGGVRFFGNNASGSGVHSHQACRGLSLIKNDRVGTGLMAQAAFHFVAEDVRIVGFSRGIEAIDTLECSFERLSVQYCDYGGLAYKSASGISQPNALSFRHCTIGHCANFGFDARNCSTFNWWGGTIEDNGIDGSDATAGKWGLRIALADFSNGPLEGSVAATITGAYIENTVGTADLWFSNSLGSTALNVIGCSFQRSMVGVAANCIRIETYGGFTNNVNLLGNGFSGFSPYVASSARPYVSVVSPAQPCRVVDLGNTYNSAAEKPAFSAPYVTPRAMAAAWCRFDGTIASPVVIQGHNVASITKNGTGDYTVTYNRALGASANVYSAQVVGAAAITQIFSESAASVRIKVLNLASSVVDTQLTVAVFGGMDFA